MGRLASLRARLRLRPARLRVHFERKWSVSPFLGIEGSGFRRFYLWVAVFELNGDGKADITTANSDCVSALLGNGKGTFETTR